MTFTVNDLLVDTWDTNGGTKFLSILSQSNNVISRSGGFQLVSQVKRNLCFSFYFPKNQLNLVRSKSFLLIIKNKLLEKLNNTSQRLISFSIMLCFFNQILRLLYYHNLTLT